MPSPSAFAVTEAMNINGRADMPGHLYFYIPESYTEEVPPDQEIAHQRLEHFAMVLRIAFQATEPLLFKEFFGRLLVAAQGAFSAKGFRPESLGDLQLFQKEVVQKAGARIKARYTFSLMKVVAFATVVLLALGIGLEQMASLGTDSESVKSDLLKAGSGVVSPAPDSGDKFKSIGTVVRWNKSFSFMHTGILLAAAMWGLLFASMTRNIDPTFETIITPDADLMTPAFRLVFFGIPIFIIALIFQLRVVAIWLGERFSTSQINDDMVAAILVGLLLGVSERALPKEVEQWSKKILPSSAAK